MNRRDASDSCIHFCWVKFTALHPCIIDCCCERIHTGQGWVFPLYLSLEQDILFIFLAERAAASSGLWANWSDPVIEESYWPMLQFLFHSKLQMAHFIAESSSYLKKKKEKKRLRTFVLRSPFCLLWQMAQLVIFNNESMHEKVKHFKITYSELYK